MVDVGLEELVGEHVRLHPCLGVEDVYKLLFQGVMGVEHLLEDEEAAWRGLKEEFERVDASEFPEEPLLERVSIDGSVVRVNLRVFKRLGLSLKELFRAMLRSAERIKADKMGFVRLWNGYVGLVREGRLDFDFERLLEFDRGVRTRGHPPVHHSGRYVEANKPAYRITSKRTYKAMFR